MGCASLFLSFILRLYSLDLVSLLILSLFTGLLTVITLMHPPFVITRLMLLAILLKEFKTQLNSKAFLNF